MTQEPGGFVRDAELSANDHCRHAFAGGGDQVDRHEPGWQRQVSALHGRACSHAELLLAGSACPGARLRRLPGIRNGAALVADRTMWPARACEVLDALLLFAKSVRELFYVHANIMSKDLSKVNRPAGIYKSSRSN